MEPNAHDLLPPCHINANTTHFRVKRILPGNQAENVHIPSVSGVSEQEWPNAWLTNKWVREHLDPGDYRFVFIQKMDDGRQQSRGSSAVVQVREPGQSQGMAPPPPPPLPPTFAAPPPPPPMAAAGDMLSTVLLVNDAISQRADAAAARDREFFQNMHQNNALMLERLLPSRGADPLASLTPVLQQLAQGQQQISAVISQQGQMIAGLSARLEQMENELEEEDEEEDEEPTPAGPPAPPIDPDAPLGDTLIAQGRHALIQNAPMLMEAFMTHMQNSPAPAPAPAAAAPAATPPAAPPAPTPQALPAGTRVA